MLRCLGSVQAGKPGKLQPERTVAPQRFDSSALCSDTGKQLRLLVTTSPRPAAVLSTPAALAPGSVELEFCP
eukprot:COSAG06_NODE_3818_length_4876_cov_168.368223_2_plen_72_part_00